MAKREELVIDIDSKGNISTEVTSGPGGKGCLDMLDEILGKIGKKTVESNKPEMYRAVNVAKTGQTIKR